MCVEVRGHFWELVLFFHLVEARSLVSAHYVLLLSGFWEVLSPPPISLQVCWDHKCVLGTELLTAVCHLVLGIELSTLSNTCSYVLSHLPSPVRYRLCVSLFISWSHLGVEWLDHTVTLASLFVELPNSFQWLWHFTSMPAMREGSGFSPFCLSVDYSL